MADKRKKHRRPVVTVLKTALIVVLAVILVGLVGVLVAYQRMHLPDANSDFRTNTTFIYYRDGTTKIGSLSIQNRQSIDYNQMPASIKDATVAAENRTFWTDPGISPTGIARAAWTILRGGDLQGGSTITQQYIKIMYLSPQRTMTRKLRELILAVKLGRQLPKQQILADYLNTVYFGRGAYGIQAASKAYFNADASTLTLGQSAVLASILNNPSLYDPSVDPSNKARLFARYQYVLGGMLQAGNITQAQYDAAAKALPTFPEVPVNSTYGGTKGFLINQVVTELRKDGYSDSQIQGGGLQVITTFDAKLQAAAVQIGQQYVQQAASAAGQNPNGLHAAIASVQVGTGEVLAMYGGDNYVKNSRNWATTPREAASTFKAWATIAALRNGMTLNTVLNGNTWTPPGDTVPVRNEFHEEYGPVTLRKAVTDSINTAFVDAVSRIDNGPQQVIQAAEQAGIPKGPGWDDNDRIALGTAEVSPLDNASGYATLANDGVAVPEHVVKQVKDMNGKVLFTAPETGKQTIEKDVAANVTSALRSVVTQGTGTAVSGLGHDIAGKTGTAGVGTSIVSAWFVAYTKQISTAVMYVAGDSGNADLDPYKRPSDATFFGGTYPAETWGDFMRIALEGLPNEPFTTPTQPSPAPVATSATPPATSTTPTTSASTPSVPTSAATSATRPATSATRTSTPSHTPSRIASSQPTDTPTSPKTSTPVRERSEPAATAGASQGGG